MDVRPAVIFLLANLVLLPGSECWPGGAAMYECCCPEKFACQQSCFMCRNTDFVCNCAACSCYVDESDGQQTAMSFRDKGLLHKLLKSGGSSKKKPHHETTS